MCLKMHLQISSVLLTFTNINNLCNLLSTLKALRFSQSKYFKSSYFKRAAFSASLGKELNTGN